MIWILFATWFLPGHPPESSHWTFASEQRCFSEGTKLVAESGTPISAACVGLGSGPVVGWSHTEKSQ
jgi:hypothetical protein